MGGVYSTEAAQGYLIASPATRSPSVIPPTTNHPPIPTNHPSIPKLAPTPPPECPMHDKIPDASSPPSAPIPITAAPQTEREHLQVLAEVPSECPMADQLNAERKEKMSLTLTEGDKENDVDQTNMMPPPNQMPSPGQPFSLSTDRQKSTIPKASEEDETWTYPSEQMFWNAMLRKGE